MNDPLADLLNIFWLRASNANGEAVHYAGTSTGDYFAALRRTYVECGDEVGCRMNPPKKLVFWPDGKVTIEDR